jgi:hypothetical protein
MALEMGLIEADILKAGGAFAGDVLRNPIHQGKGVAMGEQAVDLLSGVGVNPDRWRKDIWGGRTRTDLRGNGTG